MPLLPPTTQPPLLITRRNSPLSHSLTSTEELTNTADTSPRQRVRMNTELSRESTELSFLTAECRLCPTTLTTRMASLLMSDTRERPTPSPHTRPPSTPLLTTLSTPPPLSPITPSTLLPWWPTPSLTMVFTMLSMAQLLLPSTTPSTLSTMRLLLVEMVPFFKCIYYIY